MMKISFNLESLIAHKGEVDVERIEMRSTITCEFGKYIKPIN